MPEVYDPLTDPAPAHDVRAVLRIRAFRRLWIAFGLSSLGDWIGLLALTAMAKSFAGDDYQAANFAIGGVLFLRVLPALVMGPVAGWIADRLDRRWTMIIGDLVRAAFFVSIPLVGTLTWVLVATVLIEIVSLIWGPAKDASVPNLVPRHRLEAANQISLITTYGTALPAAVIFTAITLLFRWAGDFAINLAVYVNAATFVVSALAILSVAEIGRAVHEHEDHPTLWRTMVEGWSYVTGTPVVRGLVVGISGAFAAGAVVIGLGRTYVEDLGAGDPGYGVLFGAVFGGLALGMGFGPQIFSGLSRRRLFAAGLVGSGICLAGLALIQQIEIATMIAILLGFCAGASWVSGYTLLGLEVPDAVRGRTFAFVQSAVRTVLAVTLAIAPFAAGRDRPADVHDRREVRHLQRRLDDHADRRDRGRRDRPGRLAADGRPSGRPVLARRTAKLRQDYWCVSDHRPVHRARRRRGRGEVDAVRAAGGVARRSRASRSCSPASRGRPTSARRCGRSFSIRPPATSRIAPRRCIYAADKAEHVDSVIKPALKAGAVVITDRYVDSALAYQGSGRDLDLSDVERVNRWATDDLRPNLTILLDLPPKSGLGRFAERDRIESQSHDFHERVRTAFLELAAAEPQHYLVLDATQDRDDLAQQIRARLQPILPKVDL